MPTETNEKDTNPSEIGETGSMRDMPGCGPECQCGGPAVKDNRKAKIVVCLAVAVAVIGILLFKTTSARQGTPDIGTKGFATNLAEPGKGVVLNSAAQQGGSGASLSAIAELNTVAANLDTVFVVVPAKNNAPLVKEAGSAVASIERTLNSKGLSTGVYTLRVDSQDYPDVAAQVKAPGIAVLTKGRGIGFVSGNVTETSVMQAYVASTRSGGCCPPGGSAPAKPCN